MNCIGIHRDRRRPRGLVVVVIFLLFLILLLDQGLVLVLIVEFFLFVQVLLEVGHKLFVLLFSLFARRKTLCVEIFRPSFLNFSLFQSSLLLVSPLSVLKEINNHGSLWLTFSEICIFIANFFCILLLCLLFL